MIAQLKELLQKLADNSDDAPLVQQPFLSPKEFQFQMETFVSSASNNSAAFQQRFESTFEHKFAVPQAAMLQQQSDHASSIEAAYNAHASSIAAANNSHAAALQAVQDQYKAHVHSLQQEHLAQQKLSRDRENEAVARASREREISAEKERESHIFYRNIVHNHIMQQGTSGGMQMLGHQQSRQGGPQLQLMQDHPESEQRKMQQGSGQQQHGHGQGGQNQQTQ